MARLFQNLIWPAVAGNVMWALFSIAVGDDWHAPGFGARLATLLILAIYLVRTWQISASDAPTFRRTYWIADSFHALTIVVLALATQSDVHWLSTSMGTAFAIAAVGHFLGFWEHTDLKHLRWARRLVMIGVNFIGIAVLVFMPAILPAQGMWHIPIALGSVTGFWIMLGAWVYDS